MLRRAVWKRSAAPLLAAAGLCLAASAGAGGERARVVLTDGTVITGEVVAVESGTLTIQSDALGRVRVPQASVREIERPHAAPPKRVSAHERRGPDTRADATSLEIESDDAPALRSDALIEHALAIRIETPNDALFEASGLLDEAGADLPGGDLDPLPANLAPGAAPDLRD